MPKRKIINELRQLLKQRGTLTREQREYARTEVNAIMRMYPITKPADELRCTNLRTLKSYVGEYSFRMIAESKGVGVIPPALF